VGITEAQVERAESSLRLMDLESEDARDATRLLMTAPTSSPSRLAACVEVAGFRGTWMQWAPDLELDAENAILALLLAVPATTDLLQQRGLDPEIIESTMADFGRHFRRHRRFFGGFGLSNWRWFLGHVAGNLYGIGRLQYKIHQSDVVIDGRRGRWVAGIHIPGDSGPLTPAAVEESLRTATTVLARVHPDLGIRYATCTSWLLDPWLTARLGSSNISAFSSRFTSFAPPIDDPTDPPYFLWGSRDPAMWPERGTSRLERLVLERIGDGGVWQAGNGYLRLSNSSREATTMSEHDTARSVD
jgi:hypothetical protein